MKRNNHKFTNTGNKKASLQIHMNYKDVKEYYKV
jgi:hypothetical protein